MTPPIYYSYVTAARHLTSDPWTQSSLGVIARPVDPELHTGRRGGPTPDWVGTAVPAGDTVAQGRAGGGAGEPEVVWRLVVRGDPLPGAYLLRAGTFIELGDAAEWVPRRDAGNMVEQAGAQWRWGGGRIGRSRTRRIERRAGGFDGSFWRC